VRKGIRLVIPATMVARNTGTHIIVVGRTVNVVVCHAPRCALAVAQVILEEAVDIDAIVHTSNHRIPSHSWIISV
jgi:hypothetical protein